MIRLLSLLLWWLACTALVAIGGLTIINALLSQDNAQRELNNILTQFFPGLSVHYSDARIKFSLSGLHLQATALDISHEEVSLIQAPHADFWLGINVLQLALQTPDIHLDPDVTTAVGGGGDHRRTLIITGENARLSFADFPVTLSQAEFALRRNGRQWQFYLNEEDDHRRINLWGNTDSSLHGAVYAELSGLPPPADAPLTWQRINTTLWVENSAATGIAYYAIADLAAVNSSRGGGAKRLHAHVTGLYHTDGNNIATLSVTGSRITTALLSVTADVDVVGSLEWQGKEWRFHADRARLGSDEIIITAAATLAGAGEQLTALAVHGGAGTIQMTAIHHYVPAGELRDWFAESLHGGEMRDAVFNLRATADFAPEDISIRLTTTVRDGILNIDDDWPPLTAPTAVFAFNNDSIHINGNARLGALESPAIVARMPRIYDKRATLYLDIPIAPAAFPDYWQTAGRIPPLRADIAAAEQAVSVTSGRAAVSLAVSVPLAQPETARFNATLNTRYLQAHPAEFLPLTNAGGQVIINNDGVTGHIVAKLDDPRLAAPLLTIDFNDTTQTISGGANISLLMALPDIPDFPATGDMQFRIERTATLTVLTAPLQGIVIDLPTPLGKAANTFASVSIRLAKDETTAFFHNEALTLRLLSTADGGDLAINTIPRPPTGGTFNIHGSVNNVNLDLWLAAANADDADHALASAGVLLTVTDAVLMGLDHATLAIDMPPPAGDRIVWLQSPLLEGQIIVRPDAIWGEFSHLSLPEKSSGGNSSDFDIRQVTVFLSAATVRIGDLHLGAMELTGVPAGDDWRLSRLNLYNQQTTLFLGGTFEQQYTYLTLILDAPNLPQFLDILGINDTIGEGRLSLVGSIAWPGAPTDFDPFNMKGLLRLQAADVRYLNTGFQSDVVNFLAIFSPQSLFSLGFTEIGKEGIIFNRVEGEIVIADGSASLRPIYLQSKDVVMDINGETNFIYRQHNLHGRVRPGKQLLKAGQSVGIGAGLLAISPVSFLAGTLLGKVFERPISEIGAYNYTITGSWEKPVYIEVGIDSQSSSRP